MEVVVPCNHIPIPPMLSESRSRIDMMPSSSFCRSFVNRAWDFSPIFRPTNEEQTKKKMRYQRETSLAEKFSDPPFPRIAICYQSSNLTLQQTEIVGESNPHTYPTLTWITGSTVAGRRRIGIKHQRFRKTLCIPTCRRGWKRRGRAFGFIDARQPVSLLAPDDVCQAA